MNTITIQTVCGNLTRSYIPTPIPGVGMVHVFDADDDGQAEYTLTHLRTGTALVIAEHPETLALVAHLLAPLDWTVKIADTTRDHQQAAIDAQDLVDQHEGFSGDCDHEGRDIDLNEGFA